MARLILYYRLNPVVHKHDFNNMLPSVPTLPLPYTSSSPPNLSPKELSLCHKLKTCTTYIFAIQLFEPLIFQTMIIWSNTINSLKYQRFTTLGCRDKRIRISEFVAKLKSFIIIIRFKVYTVQCTPMYLFTILIRLLWASQLKQPTLLWLGSKLSRAL